MEPKDEIKEYDRLIKEYIKEGFFDEQEKKFEWTNFNDSNIFNETTYLYETKSENLNSFNVYLYFKINGKNEDIFLIESAELNIDTQCVSDLISNIVQKINYQKIIINYENNEFILSLKEYKSIVLYNNNYEIRPFDRISNSPKYNCLSFSPTSMLDELISQEICFIVKKISNIKLSEKSDEEH